MHPLEPAAKKTGSFPRPMQTLDEKSPSSEGAVLVRRRPTRAVALAGVFAGLLAFVPLYIAPGIEPLRVATFLVLATASVALVRLGRSRSRPERTVVVRRPDGLVWGAESLPLPSHVALGGDGTEEPPVYRALVVWADGRERVALESSEPGPLLRDALALARRLELDLRPGWGLEQHFPAAGFVAAWERAAAEARSNGHARAASVDLPLWPVQRKTAAICLASGFFVLLVTAGLARSPERSASPSALELVLTALSAAIGLALGAAFFGLRRRTTLSGDRLRATITWYGRPVGDETDLGAVAPRAFGVTPDGAFVRHVLFVSAGGPISLVADAESAERLTARAADPSPPERLSPPRATTSPRYSRPDRPARLRS
jgi:hypothetical protein